MENDVLCRSLATSQHYAETPVHVFFSLLLNTRNFHRNFYNGLPAFVPLPGTARLAGIFFVFLVIAFTVLKGLSRTVSFNYCKICSSCSNPFAYTDFLQYFILRHLKNKSVRYINSSLFLIS